MHQHFPFAVMNCFAPRREGVNKPTRIFIVMMMFALSLSIPVLGFAERSVAPLAAVSSITPETTIIVSNGVDARFSQDYSTLLKQLRLDWVILTSAVLPESVTDKNLVIIGHPDAEYTGDLIRELLTEDEVEDLLAVEDQQVVLEIESPWMEGRTVIICSGADLLLARNAAEEAFREIIAAAPPAGNWLQTTYEAERDESLMDYVALFRYRWEDEELPMQDLAIDVEADLQNRISAQEAEEDVERLFSILSHGYSGYGFFNRNGAFERAKDDILEEIASRDSWSSDDFTGLLRDHLGFIVDCHMRIGEHQFCQHSDFWYDMDVELVLGRDGYQFVVDDKMYTLVSINGADPQAYLFPSLNQRGEPVYRLGALSAEDPQPLLLDSVGEEGERQFEIDLQRSDFDHYSDDLFREDMLGGIPVMRIRSFTDIAPDELNQFVATGTALRDDPVAIIDLRGNGGGNEHWPVSWIQRLTGKRAESVLIFAELESRTSMMGRANAFEYWDYVAPGSSSFRSEADRYARIAALFEDEASQPRWTGPVYPTFSLIPNDTTIVVVMNDQVASAGEGMVMRISRLENVIVVGENSMGALTFGNVSTHKLPHSGLMIWLSININISADQQLHEGVGLSPDLWVPAADAVNYAVAAIRRGTISTSRALTQDILGQDFAPEDPYARDKLKLVGSILFVLAFAAGGTVWAYFTRQKPRIVFAIGGIWIVLGGVYTGLQEQPVGSGFLIAGIIGLVWGGINLLKGRRAAKHSEGDQL
jgi:hypothetical protein